MNDHPDRKIVTTRIFDAPREIVFSVWTNPELLKRWWTGWEIVIKTIDKKIETSK